MAPLTAEAIDAVIAKRGLDLHFLDGETWTRVRALSKPVRKALQEEKHVLTKDSPRFIHGKGLQA